MTTPQMVTAAGVLTLGCALVALLLMAPPITQYGRFDQALVHFRFYVVTEFLLVCVSVALLVSGWVMSRLDGVRRGAGDRIAVRIVPFGGWFTAGIAAFAIAAILVEMAKWQPHAPGDDLLTRFGIYLFATFLVTTGAIAQLVISAAAGRVLIRK